MSLSFNIFIAGKNKMNNEMLARFLEKEGFNSRIVELADGVLSDDIRDGVLLLDIAGFDSGIWQIFDNFKLKNVSVVVFIPQGKVALKQEAFNRGAFAVIEKPLKTGEILSLIRSLSR